MISTFVSDEYGILPNHKVVQIGRFVIRHDPWNNNADPPMPAEGAAHVRKEVHRYTIPMGNIVIFDREDPHSFAFARIADEHGNVIPGIVEVHVEKPNGTYVRRVFQGVSLLFSPEGIRDSMEPPPLNDMMNGVSPLDAPKMMRILGTHPRAWTPYPNDMAFFRAGDTIVTSFYAIISWKMDPKRSRIAHALQYGKLV